MTTIVTRAGKGIPLTWAEQDANITNLNNAVIAAATASGTSNTPAGSIAATNVQAALNELDTTGNQLVKVNGSGVVVGTASEDALQINTTAKTISAVTPYQMNGNGPAFSATGSTFEGTANVSTKALVTTEVFDTNNAYDAPNSLFSPAVPGYYQINATGGNQNAGPDWGLYLSLVKNGSTTIATGGGTGNAYAFARASATAIVYMNGTTDTVEVFITALHASGTLTVFCSDLSGELLMYA